MIDVETVTLPRIEKPEDVIRLVDDLIRAQDTLEDALRRGVPKMHAIELVLLQDRNR